MSLNFKYLLYYKITFYNIIKYYWSLLFKLRNKYILIKPNYYYFRNQANQKIEKKKYSWRYMRHLYVNAFQSTKTRRNINTLWHFTKNFYFFKNLYIYNLNTYIYMYNSLDIEFNIKFNKNKFL